MEVRHQQDAVRWSDESGPRLPGACLAEQPGGLGQDATDAARVFVPQEEALPILAGLAQLALERQLQAALPPEHRAVPGPRPELLGELVLQVLGPWPQGLGWVVQRQQRHWVPRTVLLSDAMRRLLKPVPQQRC